MAKLRRLGDITSDLEPLLFELAVDHDMQHGEILAQIYNWLIVHVPSQREEYVSGGSPIFYGPKEVFNERRKNQKTKTKRSKL